jgi:hypothetical protein
MGPFCPQGLKPGVEDPICSFSLSDDRFLSFITIDYAGYSIPGLALLFILWTEGCESMARSEVKSEDQESGRACWIAVSFERLPLL